MSDLDDMRAAHRAAVEDEVRALEAHQRGWNPTIHGQFVNAASLVREAASHYERAHADGVTDYQFRNRTDQAMSLAMDAIKALATSMYLMAEESLKR